MIPFPLSVSSHSRRFPLSSVAFLDLRPPPAPPPEPPSPPAPPKPPDPPDPQICFCFGESLPQLPFFTSFRAFDSLLPPSSARSGFTSPASLPLLPTKALASMGLLLPVESPFAIWFGELGPRLCPATTLFRQVGYVADAPTFPPQTLPQVCSYSSPYNPSEMGNWMLIEFVALVWWLSDLFHWVSMRLDTLVSTFVFFCSTHIALVRLITAVCRFCLNVVLLEVVSWQPRQGSLFQYNWLVNLAHWGFYCPHFSFTELFILPYTSLVFSDSVTGSNVLKTVLLEVEAKIVDQDCFRSAFADCLALTTLEALVPPPLCVCVVSGVRGLGWLLKDPTGSITLQATATRPFVSSALVAEALAIRSALIQVSSIAHLSSIRSLVIFSDSQVIIKLLKSGGSLKELKGILLDIFCLKESLSSISISFTFISRFNNGEADSVAKSALASFVPTSSLVECI